MWTGRRNGRDRRGVLGPPPGGAAGAAAAGHRGADADARRRPARAQERDQPRLHRHRSGGRGAPAAAGGRPGAVGLRRLPARQLAGALRHRASGRPAVGADGGAHRRHRAGHPAVRTGTLAARGCLFPRAVPVAADGAVRRLPHRRPFQPLRLLRGAAGGELRAAAARRWPGAGARRVALHRHQPRGLAALPHRRGGALRRDRHAQHGRHRAQAADGARERPRPAACGRGHPRHRLSRQGGAVAAQRLAAARLCRRQRAGGGALRHPHQGGRLRGAAPVDALLPGQCGRLGLVWR